MVCSRNQNGFPAQSPIFPLPVFQAPPDLLLSMVTTWWLIHKCSFSLSFIVALSKGPSSQGYGFSSGHVWMWGLDCEESWALKNWCFWTVLLEKTLESPLGCKEIQPVHLKGNQSWIFIGRTDAEVSIFWLPVMKSGLIGKDPNAGKDWWQKNKRATEGEIFK